VPRVRKECLVRRRFVFDTGLAAHTLDAPLLKFWVNFVR
jgi:hypothetical protein